ncbi:MAG: diacylglycerol kinase family protein [Flavobacteriaceae bacterium]|nr:diacylglycerol kinase family protein [Bacteroidia bacterium]NNK81606.1 diacylglycerol kinase family protein [Flavobacteriaceae bacterium]
MPKKESFFINRLKSIGFAIKGALLLLKTEASVKVQFVIAILITLAGFYYNISNTEWILQFLAIGLVLAIEGVNTAIENLADFIQPKHNQKIGFVKDITAGAVLFAAICAIIVGLLIYIPKF